MFRSTSSVLDSAISETLGSGNAPILGWKAVWKRRSTRRDICGPRYLKPWQSPKSLRLARLGEQVLRDVVGSVLSSSHRVLTREGRLYGVARDLGFGGRSTGKGYRTSIVLYTIRVRILHISRVERKCLCNIETKRANCRSALGL